MDSPNITTSSVGFSKLNETNYSSWIEYLHAYLIEHDMLDIALGDEPKPEGGDDSKKVKDWLRKQKKVKAAIMLRVEESQLVHFKGVDDPVKILASIKAAHTATGLATILTLRNTLHRMSRPPDMPMRMYVNRVKDIVGSLNSQGSNVDTIDHVLALLQQPKEYAPLVMVIEGLFQTDEFTVNKVTTRLLNEDARQLSLVNNDTGSGTFGDSDNLNVAFAVRTKPRTPLHMITCHRCYKKGHYQRDCPQPVPPAQANTAITFGLPPSLRDIIPDEETNVAY